MATVAEMAEVEGRWWRASYRAVKVERQATHEDLRHGCSLCCRYRGVQHRYRRRRGVVAEMVKTRRATWRRA